MSPQQKEVTDLVSEKQPSPTVTCCVTSNIEAAHASFDTRTQTQTLHGHSYVAEFWFAAGPDLPTMKVCWDTICGLVDHTQLETSVGASTMEALAAWLLQRAAIIGTANIQAIKVVVRRPTLGFVCEAVR